MMTDLKNLKELLKLIEKSGEDDSSIQRWQDRVEELQKELNWKIILFCRNLRLIPRDAIMIYADLLIEALNDADSYRIEEIKVSSSFRENIFLFANVLANTGEFKKADLIRQVIKN